MENSFKFFKNTDCRFYPCHEGLEEINCLFCYCPLYHIENCGGEYEMIEKGDRKIKNCKNCVLPHKPDNYSLIMEKLREDNRK